jgi:dTDP-4-dehydrorhamnose reductase
MATVLSLNPWLPDYTPTMRWAVLGSKGMLGNELVEYLGSQGESVTGFHRNNLDLESQEPPTSLFGFDVVVNCIAYTKVGMAEDEPDRAHLANALIPEKLARDLKDQPTRLIHISTDYVFDGNKGSPYLPEDKRSPLGVYGKTKAEGEAVWLAEASNSQVIRTSWLYGANGKCFPKTIGAKLLAGDEVAVVRDQFGSPTHSLDLAEFIYRAASEPLDQRILHGVASGTASWFEFARAVSAAIGSSTAVRSLATSEYPTRAQRPLDSTLEPSLIAAWQIGPWEERWRLAADRVLRDLRS